MSEPKQVIIMRADLKMRKGKACAQAAHASMKFMVDKMGMAMEPSRENQTTGTKFYEAGLMLSDMQRAWLEGSFVKVVLYVNSEAELLQYKQQAELADLVVKAVEDDGRTEFKGVKTLTCIAIGPDDPEKIDKITGLLPTW
jgi:PTH2 family peptidyl-tRNA hydrolase